ncbi:MAG: hypoxanthine/guanine phosphoribosyltransferase [Methanomassiliicoccales archaeon]
MLHKLKRELEQSPVIRLGNYDYFVSPITDGIPKMDPDILAEVIEAIIEVGDFDCDMITTPEAMGIPIAVGLSQRLHIPYNVIRKRRYRLPGEITVSQRTGYSATDLYINGIKKGDKIVFVDDVLSTGGTLIAIISALIELGAIIKDVIIVVEKGNAKSKIEKTTGVRIKTLVRVDVRDGRVVVST